MPSRIEKKEKADSETSQLSEHDIRVLSRSMRRACQLLREGYWENYPAAGAMLAYVRDDIRFESKSLLP